MKLSPWMKAALAASLTSLCAAAGAQLDVEEAEGVPDFEYHAVIQRLDPTTWTIFADGQQFELMPNAQVWIDDEAVSRDQLSGDMIGLKIGFSPQFDNKHPQIHRLRVFRAQGRLSGSGNGER